MRQTTPQSALLTAPLTRGALGGANPEDIGRCGAMGKIAGGRFVRESRYDCHRQSLGFRIRCALQHAPTPTKRRYPERDVEGAVPYGGSGQFSSVFNHPEGIHSCAMAQFMVKPIHAPRQFMPARAIHWPSAAMPPPAGSHVRNRKCLTTPPAFCPDKKPPPLTRGGMGAVQTRGISPYIRGREWRASRKGRRGAVPYKGALEMVRCHRRGDSRIARGRLIASPTLGCGAGGNIWKGGEDSIGAQVNFFTL